jgi:hypothetical protein
MRKFLTLCLALCLAPSLFATSIRGTALSVSGKPLLGGSLVFQLSSNIGGARVDGCGPGNAPIVAPGAGILLDNKKTVHPVLGGAISDVLIGNDQISCGAGFGVGTYYQVTAFDSAGSQHWQRNYRISGSVWNINNAVALQTVLPDAILEFLPVNPTTNQTVTMPGGTSLTIAGTFNATLTGNASTASLATLATALDHNPTNCTGGKLPRGIDSTGAGENCAFPIPGQQIVDGVNNANIQAAITAAGSTGSVFIPSTYAGSDTYTNPNSIPIFDLRGGTSAYKNAISVKDFGATGLGVVDEYANVHTAALAAIAAKTCLYFPAGTYRLDTALSDGVNCMAGDGVQQSILKVNNSASTNSLINITTAPDGFKINGLQFDGPGVAASGAQKGVIVGKSGGNLSDAIFQDLFLKDWPNYALELDAAIATSVRNVRVLTSKKGIFYNGGTSITTSASYMNQVTQVGYDVKGVGYSSFISNAADTVGLSYLIRNASQGIILTGNGHEIGTASNVTVTNVALTSNVATVTYTGADLSADWVSGETIVIAGTASTAGLFNVRAVPTNVTSSTIVYPLTHADVGSVADTGTACLFCGDGVVINNSTGTQINGFYGLSAQQITSNHVTVSGNSANTILTGIVSVVGTGGTPVTQTTDIYIGASAGNVFRFNTNLVGGVSGLSNQIQTYSSNLWTIGGVADNSGTPATAGFLRLNKNDALNFRNNVNSADVNGISLNGSDQVQCGGSAGCIDSNGNKFGTIIASGTSALGTGAISATTCATVVTTAATNTATTDAIEWAFNAAPGTGYTSGVHVLAYPTSGNVNFLVCNPTAGSLTPAAATLNWKVIR